VLPSNKDPLFQLAQDFPPFCASGTYSTSGTNEIQVYLQLVDSNGKQLAISADSAKLPPGADMVWGDSSCKYPKEWVIILETPMPDLPVPAGATYNQPLAQYTLEAVLIDSVTGKPLTSSTLSTVTSIHYQVELGADLQQQLEIGSWIDLGTKSFLAGTILNPKVNPFFSSDKSVSLARASSVQPLDGGSPVLFTDNTLDFDGSNAQMQTVVTELDSTGKLLAVSTTDPEKVSKGQKIDVRIPIYADLEPGVATVNVTGRLTLANGQTILFQPPVPYAVENVTLTASVPAPQDCVKKLTINSTLNLNNCPVAGAKNLNFAISGTVIAGSSTEQLVRWVAFDEETNGTPTPVPNVQLIPGTSVKFTDMPSINVPSNAKKMWIAYILTRPGQTANQCLASPAGFCTLASTGSYSVAVNTGLNVSSINTPLPIAGGTLNLLAIQTSVSVQNAVTTLNIDSSTLQNIGSVGLPAFSLDRFRSPFLNRSLSAHALSTSAAPAGTKILSSLPDSWIFSPPVPRDGKFSATLALNYSSTALPDDTNFSESKLQMISIDSAGALHVYQTTIDLTNHIATATVDGLDPYVSLAVVGGQSGGQSGQTPIMLASPATGYVLVNGGSQNANIKQTPFTPDGNGTVATAPLKPGSQTGVSPAWVQAWSDSPAAAGASWFDNGQLYAITPSTVPDGGFILPGVGYDAHTSTEIDLANTTTADADITITLFVADGSTKGTYQTILGAKNSMSERLESLFPSIATGFTGYLAVVTDGLLAVSGYRWSGSSVASLQAQSFATVKATSLFAPQLGGTAITSTVHLVNAGIGTANVTLAAYSSSPTPQTFQLKLTAGQQYTNTIDAIFGIDPATVGSLKVTSDTGAIFGDILVSDSSFIPSFAYSVPLTSQTSKSLAFPIASAATHVYVFNPNSTAANVTVTPYAANGTGGTPTTVSVAASGRADIPIGSGSYLILNSDQAVVAFATSAGSSGTIGAYPGIAVSGIGTSGSTGGTAPVLSAAGIVNAASFKGGGVSPGEIITLFGSNLGPAQVVLLTLQNNKVITSVSGAQVLFDGVPAPIIYTSSGQEAVIVPYEVFGKTSTQVQAVYQNVTSSAVAVPVVATAPALFTANAAGTGPGAILNQDYSVNSASNPAATGSFVALYGTGEGQTTPPGIDGLLAVSSTLPAPMASVSATIGGVNAPVLYAGAAPGLVAGVLQVNLLIPAGLAGGAQPVVITVGGVPSQTGVTVAVQGSGAPVPILGLSTSSLTFQNVPVGQSSTLPLTVFNTGTAALTVTSITSTNAQFAVVSPAVPFTVQPGGATVVTVQYAPAGVAAGGILSIASNDPNTPIATVILTGTAAGNMSPSISTPTGVNFSSVAQGSSKQASVTVKNTGTGPLNVTGVTAGGAFSVVSSQSFIVAPGASFTVTLQFSPVSAGGQTGTLSIASNDPARPNLTVPLWGNAYVPANVLTSDSFSRGNATECALGPSDLALGGTMKFYYLPDWPGASGPLGATITGGVLANNTNGTWGGVQLTSSSDTCNTARGAALPQDLDIVVDVYVPMTGSYVTDGGPYFRNRPAAPGDGLTGGTSSGYWVEVFSTGQVVVNQLNPFGVIAQTAIPASFDSTLVHTLEAHVQGAALQVTLDGKLQTFTQNGASTTTVTVSTASNSGTTGISFGAQMNQGKAAGQTASNLVISSVGTSTSGTPTISVPTSSSNPLQLGSITVGQTGTASFNIMNTGTAALSVTSITSSAAAVTIVTPVAPFTVQPGAMQQVNVQFAPTSAGAVLGTFTIFSNDPANGKATVYFAGAGLASSGGTTLNATLMITGSGTNSGGNISATGTVTLLGVGTGTFSSNFSLASAAATGSAPLTITINSGSPTGTLTGVLIGSPTLLVQIFAGTPTVSGPATVMFTSGTGGFAGATGNFSVTAAGTGTGTTGSGGGTFSINGPGTITIPGSSGGGTPVISAPTNPLSPLPLGNVTVGQTATASFNIMNTGTAALTVTSIASSNPAVTIVSPVVPFTVQPGGTQQVNVQFAPTVAGPLPVPGTLTISSNDPVNGKVTVYFTGTGVAAATPPTISVPLTPPAFGNVPVGQVSTLTFNVQNTGGAPLTVSSVVISNPVFGLMTPSIPITVQPGSVTAVTLVFAPQSAGAQSATMTVTSNDPSHPVVLVPMTGAGTGSPTSLLAYSNVVVGQSEMGTLTFTNTGTTPIVFTGFNTTNPAFVVTSPAASAAQPYTLMGGQSVPIIVVFTPSAYTIYNATLNLVTTTQTFTTTLTGAGVAVQ
jgi:uncharacterized protein (TIGR03437 family)